MELNYFVNKEAEMSVIGNMVMFPKKTVLAAASALSADDFQIPEHKNIFEQIVNMYDAGNPVDSATVLSRLPKEYKSIIAGACEYTPNLYNFAEYTKIVKEASQRVEAYNLIEDLQNALMNPTGLVESRDAAENILKKLNESKKSESVTAKQGILDFYARHQCPLDPNKFIKLGFANIDKDLSIEKGDYIVFGGRPSMGKTAFTLQAAYNISNKKRVGYFSLETKPTKITDRAISTIASVPLDNIKKNELSAEQWANVSKISDDYMSRDFDIIKAGGMTVNQIKDITIQKGYDVIVIDYMQLIKTKYPKEYDAVTNTSKKLQEMSQTENVVVIALSQLKREEKGRPSLMSLRSSGQIEQDADAVLLLWNDSDDDEDSDNKRIEQREEITEKIITIAKNKEGITCDKSIMFKGSTQRFYETDNRY